MEFQQRLVVSFFDTSSSLPLHATSRDISTMEMIV